MSTFTFDRSRKTRRREIRAKLAEIEIAHTRADELSKQIAILDERADRAADIHSECVRPMHEKIAAIEGRIREALTDRLPVSDGDSEEREALLSELAAANETLASETALVEALKKPLASERQKLMLASTGKQAIENELCGEQLGEPGLLDEAWIVRQQAEWLHARQRTADQQLAKFESHLRELREHDTKTRGRMGYGPQIELAEKKARRWRREVEAAREQLREANAQGNAIRQKLLDE